MRAGIASALATRVGSLALANPLICGAGEHVMTEAGIRAALAAGAAGVVGKSCNESKAAAQQLDIADYAFIRPDNSVATWGEVGSDVSLFCRSGLTQTPPETWLDTLAALDGEAARDGRFVAASLIPADSGAAVALAEHAACTGIRVLELNIGSPQSLEAAPGTILLESDETRLANLVGRVRAAFPRELWVKLPGLGTNLPLLAKAAQQAGADAVGMTGRFMAMLPDTETLAPLMGTSAGYSGGWALPITCRWLAMTRRAAGRDLPLIGTNGARSGLDIARLLLAGASAVEVTSAIWQAGFGVIGTMLDDLAAYLARKELSVSDLIGRAADALQTYQDQEARPGRWRDFVPPETRGRSPAGLDAADRAGMG
jgi:dihydroorotate dehydrogenase